MADDQARHPGGGEAVVRDHVQGPVSDRGPGSSLRAARDDEGSARVTVWFDGGCPLCRREIALMRRLDRRGAIAFLDLTTDDATCPIDRAELLARFHAQERGRPIVSGAAAFAAMWRAIPVLAWAGHAARLPPVAWLLERGYRAWLRVRPALARHFR